MESSEEHKREFSSDEQTSSSPRGILEIPVSGTESDHSGSSSRSFSSSSPEKSLEQEKAVQPWKAKIETWKKKSVQRISAISLITSSYEMSRKKSLRKRRMGT